MNGLEEKQSRTVTVTNELGLHARAAAMVAKLADTARSDVWLMKNGEQVDASSIIDILSLGCLKGTRVTVRIEHPEDMQILDKIRMLFENRFGES